jgi:tRNA threonylcarbamoyladenosine biosynthesis protein TsaE
MRATLQFLCSTADDTKELAAVIGQAARGGEVVELLSDLGGGKTTFVKGLAIGMGVSEVVQSPTFTLSQIHKAHHGLELHHFDFYRLSEPGVMSAELAESVAQPNAVVAVEWGEIVHEILPANRLTIKLSVQEGEQRVVSISCPNKLDYISEKLNNYKNNQAIA